MNLPTHTPARHNAMQRICALSVFIFIAVSAMATRIVVADFLTHTPLAGASIFDSKGRMLGTSRTDGTVTCASAPDYPIIIRYLGFKEKSVDSAAADTIFLEENVMELREVVVESKQKKRLHILAYMREYSTLSSYTDTVTMFREKMVDFMLPPDNSAHNLVWKTPRVLNSRSYYRFTNAYGLDSVSNRCGYHFSWSDWISLLPSTKIPAAVANKASATDTVRGKYSPTEIWIKNGDRLTLDVNVLADTASRKWVPNLASFFHNRDIDFEQFRLRLNYANIAPDIIDPLDLTGYSFYIESRGRGRNMFQFNRYDQPFFVSTYTEVYILDKEFITTKEAKKWDKRQFDTSQIEIFEPMEAPELQPATLALIDRVNNINPDRVRLSIAPDHRLVSRNVNKANFNIGHRALDLLKQLTGISAIRSRHKINKRWRNFQHDLNRQNNPKADNDDK